MRSSETAALRINISSDMVRSREAIPTDSDRRQRTRKPMAVASAYRLMASLDGSERGLCRVSCGLSGALRYPYPREIEPRSDHLCCEVLHVLFHKGAARVRVGCLNENKVTRASLILPIIIAQS